ncbi:DUF2798 domain-containing protein [Tepidamorphus sp. 3E244]|uniref:DUF2798 domain-containing protein n=1 Tax=Tepidamorphus sp. 3E244 TaxID=3385498 RepID=UPI0038FBFAD0
MTGKARLIFPIVMAFIMSFLMSGIVTATNIGLPPDFLSRWMSAWAFAFPPAVVATLLAQAPARYVTERIIRLIDGPRET